VKSTVPGNLDGGSHGHTERL